MNATWFDTVVTPWRRARVTRGAGARTRPDMHFLHLPQASIRYRDSGAGRPDMDAGADAGKPCVVLCADPPVVLELYDALMAQLAPQFRVVVLELPAFGLSLPRLGLGFGLETVAALVGEFLQTLNAGPYILAFPCVPAYSALWLARHRPQLVAGLVLMQAPDWPQELAWKQGRDPKRILARPLLGQLLLRLLRRRRAALWYRLALGRRELLQPFCEATDCAFDHGGAFSLASAFQQHLNGPEPDFGGITQPALVIWGAADRSHPHTDKASILRYLPQARLLQFDEAGHFPELEAPQRFAQALRQHFGGFD